MADASSWLARDEIETKQLALIGEFVAQFAHLDEMLGILIQVQLAGADELSAPWIRLREELSTLSKVAVLTEIIRSAGARSPDIARNLKAIRTRLEDANAFRNRVAHGRYFYTDRDGQRLLAKIPKNSLHYQVTPLTEAEWRRQTDELHALASDVIELIADAPLLGTAPDESESDD